MIVLAAGDQINSGEYYHHSSFKRVINFSHTQDQAFPLLSFGKGGTPLAANHLVIDDDLFALISRSKKIALTEDDLVLEDHKIPLPVMRFQSRLHFSPVEDDRFDHVINLLSSKVKNINAPESLLAIFKKDQQKDVGSFLLTIRKLFTHEIENWHTPPDVLCSIPKMKGVGIGLTPSGDDFIHGLLAALDLIQQQYGHSMKEWKNKIVQLSSTQNPYSATFIGQAAKGNYNAHSINLIHNLFDADAMDRNLDALLSYGETSGADWLAGFTTTLIRRHIWLQKE